MSFPLAYLYHILTHSKVKVLANAHFKCKYLRNGAKYDKNYNCCQIGSATCALDTHIYIGPRPIQKVNG